MFLVVVMVFLRGSTDSQSQGLPCICTFFLLLMCDNLSWRIQPYGRSCLLGGLEHRKSSGTIPTDILSRAPEYESDRYLPSIRVVYG